MIANRERMIWLAALSLTSFLAWNFGRGEAGETSGSSASASNRRGVTGSSGGTEAGERGAPRLRGGTVAIPRDGTALQNYTAKVLRNSDPISRTSGFMSILDLSTPENFQFIHEAWKDLRFSGTYLPNEELMMNFRAGELMGRKILGQRLGSDRDLSMMNALKPQFRGWVKGDPADARRWLDELPQGDYRRQMMLTYVGAIAEDDPAKSLGEISQLPQTDHAAAGGSIIVQLRQTESIDVASDFLASQAAAGNKPDSMVFRGMFDSLVNGTLEGDGELTTRLIEKHAGMPYVNPSWLTRAAALRGQRDENTGEVLAWALRMEKATKDVAPGSILSAATANMTPQMLSSAKLWVESQPDSPGSQVLRRAIEERSPQTGE